MEARVSRFLRWHCAPYLKSGGDSSLLFYPWSYWGGGYRIPTRKRWEQLHRTMSFLTLAGWAPVVLPGWYVLVWTGRFEISLAVWIVCSIAAIGAFLLWLRSVVSELEPVEEELSRRDVRDQRKALMTRDLRIFLVTLPMSLAILAIAVAGLDLGARWAFAAAAAGIGGLIIGLWSLRRSSTSSTP